MNNGVERKEELKVILRHLKGGTNSDDRESIKAHDPQLLARQR